MKRYLCFPALVLALLMVPAPPAGVAAAGGQGGHAQQADQTAKKRYSRGITKAKVDRAAAPPSASAIQWEPFVGMDAQLFPSFIVSTATLRLPQEDDAEVDPRQLGETLGFIGAALDGVPAGSRLRVEVKPNAVMEASAFEGQAAEGSGDYEIYPKINFKYDALLDWRQPMPLNIAMEVFVDGRSFGTQTSTVTVRSINDCPLAIIGESDDEEDLDLSWMFAAYVNENHPWVDTLTREALDARVVDAFSAYQSDEPAEVIRQVYAIWDALQRRGMRYSDISQASAESPVVMSQHVRLFDEALSARQANCVDGTAMFAAVLRKIGIEPYLVLMPGHMFLAFDLDADGNEAFGLETTMMGASVPADARRSDMMPDELVRQFRGRASFASFAAAVEAGTRQLDEHLDDFEGDDPEFQVISLSDSRQIGILPLAYRKAAGGQPPVK